MKIGNLFPFQVGQKCHHQSQGEVVITFMDHRKIRVRSLRTDVEFNIGLERATSLLFFDETTSTPSSGIAPSNVKLTNKAKSVAIEELLSEPEIPLGGGGSREQSRPYQVAALSAVSNSLHHHDNVILALPTGSGKTFVAVKWIVDHVVRRGGKVVWVAHRQELLEQAYLTFARLLPQQLGSQISWWSGSKSKNPFGQVVLVSVGASRTLPPLHVDLLVIDEAHHEPAPTYQRLREKITYKKHLGLTATPERLDAKALGYEAIAYQRTFFSLVDEGWLARPIPVLPHTGQAYELSERMDDFADESLNLLNTPARNNFIVEHWLENREKYGKTLLFAINIEHAESLVSLFRRACTDSAVDYVVSGLRPDERSARVQKFRSGLTQLMVNCRVFTEGFDVPDVKTILLTRPTLSATLYLQMVGRGTRITPDKREFFLVDFQDDLGRFQSKLIAPWILESATNDEACEPAQSSTLLSEERLSSDVPQWLYEEMEVAPVELSQIAGYVEYKHKNKPRPTGFLVHTADEASFMDAWGLAEDQRSACASEAEAARVLIEEVTRATISRIGLAELLAACLARVAGRAKYVRLLHRTLPPILEEFLSDVELGQDDLYDLANHIGQLYAVIKYRADEIDSTLTHRPVFSIERRNFDNALIQLEQARHAIGLERRNIISAIYLENLEDTNFIEYDWERFAMSWLINKNSCIQYIELS